MKEIYIIRHGQTDFNKRGIVQGSGVDSDLNDYGLAQAAAFYAAYKNEAFDQIFCSTLKRTHQTVQAFIDAKIPLKKTALINEMNWGIHEGKPSEPWMHQGYKDMVDAWGNGNLDARIPEGESARELIDRIGKFIENLKQISSQKILICSHGRAIRCLICLLKKAPYKNMEIYKHANTGLYLTQYKNDAFHFLLENDIRHLNS